MTWLKIEDELINMDNVEKLRLCNGVYEFSMKVHFTSGKYEEFFFSRKEEYDKVVDMVYNAMLKR